MGKAFRVIILLVLLFGTVGLARNQVAWAQPEKASHSSIKAQDVSPASVADDDDDDEDGSVKPPPKKVKICKKGNYSLGGQATLKVKSLARQYCLIAVLRKHGHNSGDIPQGAGKILADLTDFQVIYRNHSVKSLPAADGYVELCYAVPPGKEAKIYYLNQKQHVWSPMETTMNKGVACARIQGSGIYALIGK